MLEPAGLLCSCTPETVESRQAMRGPHNTLDASPLTKAIIVPYILIIGEHRARHQTCKSALLYKQDARPDTRST